MTDAPRRLPPADPQHITLSYRHDHGWWYDADTAPETWHLSADIYDDSGTHIEAHVGDMRIVAIDVYETRDPFSLLDGEEADLGLIAETIFDVSSGRLDTGLEDLLEPLGSRILILNSVRLTAPWRGYGLGALLAGIAIKKLGGGARAAVCYPAPINEQDDEQDPATREQAVEALGRVWAQLGFEHFRDGVHVLDLNLITFEESLDRLRKNAERHQSFGG
jgi:hypothetical protein